MIKFLNNELFSFLTIDEKKELLQKTSLVIYRKGDLLVKKGEITTQVSLLVDGFVKVYGEDGTKNRIIDVIKKDRILDILSVFGSDVYNLSATALSDVKVLLVEKNSLMNILNNNEYFRNYIFKTLSTLSSRYVNFLAFQNNKNVTGRVAEALLYLSHHVYENYEFNQTFTRKEMAELAGTTTETIIRVLSELKKDKIITIEDKIITIKNIEYLNKLAYFG